MDPLPPQPAQLPDNEAVISGDVPDTGATRTTIYDNLKGMPAFYMNRRNRSRNRAKIDKTQRNQKAIRKIRNAFKRGVPGVHDIRIDVSDRDTYASCKPIFRGVKKWVREEDRAARLNALIDDQRCRYHIMREEFRTSDALSSLPEFEAACRVAEAKYNRLEPVKPYVSVLGRHPLADKVSP